MHPRHKRYGAFEPTVVLGLALIALIGFSWQFLPESLESPIDTFFEAEDEYEYLTTAAVVTPFEHVVIERGEIESSSNVEVRCLVRGRSSSSSVNILEIVPEGTWVEEGEFLVRLDDAELQTRLIQQQIICSNSKSSVIESNALMESAKLALNEYAEGTYIETLAKYQSELFVAEENMRRAAEYLIYSARLAERGYIPDAQLDADQFALEKSKKELGVANTQLEVFTKYTRERMMTQLNAAIRTSEAKVQSREKTWELDELQLKGIEDQIKLCYITAPVAGQVVYEQNRRSSSSTILIEEGMPVRERQIIINLPDPAKMRVVAKVHESRIGFISPGQSTQLQLDSLMEISLTGTVTEVSEYPLPPISSYMSHVKEYPVSIQIDNPPRDLRPGMTAQARILIESLEDVLQIPIESVIEREDRYFCAIPDVEGKLEVREITVGSVNDTNLVVSSGLEEGELVVLNVGDADIISSLDLP